MPTNYITYKQDIENVKELRKGNQKDKLKMLCKIIADIGPFEQSIGRTTYVNYLAKIIEEHYVEFSGVFVDLKSIVNKEVDGGKLNIEALYVAGWLNENRIYLGKGNDLISKIYDPKAASNYYKISANAGYALAQLALGRQLKNQNQEKIATIFFKKAANLSNAAAQYELGNLYLNKNDIDKEGIDWLKKSAEQGYAPAQFDLATRHINGRGVEVDLYKATELLWQSAVQGNRVAQLGWIMRYEKGIGTDRNLSKALELYSKMPCEGEDEIAHNQQQIDRITEKLEEWHLIFKNTVIKKIEGEDFYIDHKEVIDEVIKHFPKKYYQDLDSRLSEEMDKFIEALQDIITKNPSLSKEEVAHFADKLINGHINVDQFTKQILDSNSYDKYLYDKYEKIINDVLKQFLKEHESDLDEIRSGSAKEELKDSEAQELKGKFEKLNQKLQLDILRIINAIDAENISGKLNGKYSTLDNFEFSDLPLAARDLGIAFKDYADAPLPEHLGAFILEFIGASTKQSKAAFDVFHELKAPSSTVSDAAAVEAAKNRAKFILSDERPRFKIGEEDFYLEFETAVAFAEFYGNERNRELIEKFRSYGCTIEEAAEEAVSRPLLPKLMQLFTMQAPEPLLNKNTGIKITKPSPCPRELSKLFNEVTRDLQNPQEVEEKGNGR
ncbi:MAG: hypothetical protein K0R25_485 [Rickettsiaceae bacterium]|jgi:hypothetical protein|nr:hypothetical protein [Rickettsiaceae bacterium]